MCKICFSNNTNSKNKAQEAKFLPLVIKFHPKLKVNRTVVEKCLNIL